MFAFLIAATMAAAPTDDPCAYDRAHLMSLDQSAFDQDMQGGWRMLAYNPKCRLVAADLVRDYRDAHHSTASILFWHEGQLRAEAGQTLAAIALFEKSREKEPDLFGWNLYVDGTIAFLRHDRPALLAASKKLAALPRPPDFNPLGPDGKPMNFPWPMNLNILEGFLACFDRSYAEAYGNEKCSPPTGRIELPDRTKTHQRSRAARTGARRNAA